MATDNHAALQATPGMTSRLHLAQPVPSMWTQPDTLPASSWRTGRTVPALMVPGRALGLRSPSQRQWLRSPGQYSPGRRPPIRSSQHPHHPQTAPNSSTPPNPAPRTPYLGHVDAALQEGTVGGVVCAHVAVLAPVAREGAADAGQAAAGRGRVVRPQPGPPPRCRSRSRPRAFAQAAPHCSELVCFCPPGLPSLLPPLPDRPTEPLRDAHV